MPESPLAEAEISPLSSLRLSRDRIKSGRETFIFKKLRRPLRASGSPDVRLPIHVPDLSERAVLSEMMDDYSIADRRLTRALLELRYVNRFLGGLRAVRMELEPLIRHRRGGSLSVLDVGTGIADIPELIVRLSDRYAVHAQVTAIDANPATVAFARESLDDRLDPELRGRVNVAVGDVLDLRYPDDRFDVAIASLFLHHFYEDVAVRALREMDRVASTGVLINDLHRHPIAYAAIRSIARLFPVSEMFGHDGPASVRRGFKPGELNELANEAGLRNPRIRRHWAYRLTLSTLPV